MKTVYVQEPGKIEIKEIDIPVIKEGEALLKLKYCGICGSDVATYTGNQPFTTYPRIPGHEFSAEIVDIAKNDRNLEKGMIVTANPYFNCEKCYSCKRGYVNCCEDNQTMGVQRDGSFAEYITMPIERIVDGKGLSPKILALVEPFSIGYHAVNRGQIKSKDKVLVIGAGPIGIFAMISAKLKGAEVYVADMLDKRLKLAIELGADGIIDSSKENLKKKVKEITSNNGMDVCIEAVGLAETFLSCIDNVCFAGKIILIGNGKRETTFNHSVLLKKELNVFGSRNSLNDFEPLIEILASSSINIERLITDVYDLENATKAFEALKNNDGSKAKVLIEFNS
jgi:2-desacetyl-2-hydroxyethyl bacteriochlorophyllide A dehydrogenase